MRRKVKKTKRQVYNVRIIDNGNKTFSLGSVHRLREYIGGGGEWIDGSARKVTSLIQKGQIAD